MFETGFTHARSQGRIHRLAGRATAALTVTLLLGTGQLLLATPASADPLPETYTVDIDLNGHGDDYSVQVPRSERLSEPAAPSAPGWNFTGWYDDAAATEKAYLPTDIYGAATLYAGWRSITESVVVDGLVLAVDPLDFTSGASVVHNQPGPLAVTIPAATVINGQTYPVTTVGAAAFRNNGLSAVTLPNSLTSIGFMAFASNTLTSLSLPPSVTTIGAYAFLENKITTLSLADSVTHIGEGAFAFNALTSVRIPNGLTTILGIAFGYNALSTVTIPDSVTTIGSGAFAVNRLTSVNIGASVQNIESDAFMWNSLTSVTIPAAVTAIGANAFGSNFDVDWRDYPDFENMPTAVDTPSTLTRVDFLGAAPAHLVPGPYLGEEPWDDQPSLGHEGLLTVFYSLGFEGTDPATHFTAGSWQGYASQAVATVNFSLNGHGSAAAQRVVPGARATDPKPTAAGWTFTGWYSDPGLTQPFAFSTAISTDLTLYAGWKANAVTPPASWKPTMKRISGTDRYATSVALSKAGFAKTAPVVYIATGTNYPDALGAAPAATKEGGPLLLTPPAALPAVVKTEIARLKPGKIIVVGGTAAVSDTVLAELKKLAPTVKRVAGSDRFDTARQVVTQAFGSSVASAYLATGLNYPDALSASAAAGANGIPVLLVNGGATSADTATKTLLTKLNVKNVTVVGGKAAVSNEIVSSLKSIGKVTRISGTDRFDTSQKVNKAAFTTIKSAYLATGFQFPDALAGAALAGAKGAPLYVVQPTCIPAGIHTDLTSFTPTTITLIGGTSALSDTVLKRGRC